MKPKYSPATSCLQKNFYRTKTDQRNDRLVPKCCFSTLQKKIRYAHITMSKRSDLRNFQVKTETTDEVTQYKTTFFKTSKLIISIAVNEQTLTSTVGINEHLHNIANPVYFQSGPGSIADEIYSEMTYLKDT